MQAVANSEARPNVWGFPLLIFDADLRLYDFSESAAAIFKHTAGLAAKMPLVNVCAHLGYGDAQADALRVLETQQPLERELSVGNGDWYSLRLCPHHQPSACENGVALVLHDIGKYKKIEARMRARESRLWLVMDRLPALVWTCGPDLRLTSIFGSAMEQFGIEPVACEQKNLLDLFEVAPDSDLALAHQRALAGRSVELQHVWRNRSLEVFVEPGSDLNDVSRPQIRGFAVDVTSHVALEQRLRQALANQESLLKEVHHRVKNNLQMIVSILNLQSEQLREEQCDPHLLETFGDCRNRIMAIAQIHEMLHRADHADMLPANEYLSTLAKKLVGSLTQGSRNRIEHRVSAPNARLDTDTAISLGMLVTELITNSIKHGFRNRSQGRIEIDLNETANELVLTYRDTGQGFSREFDFASADTLGMLLIADFATRMQGSVEYPQPGPYPQFLIRLARP